MGAGAIPVILIDHYVLPLSALIDWSEVAIVLPEHRLAEVPDILRALSPKRVETMQRNVARTYEVVLASLAHQAFAAVEQLWIDWLPSAEEKTAARAAVFRNGLSVPPEHQVTPETVQTASRDCNAPAHRRKKARDGAVMR
jgi:hypothetical protein